MQYEAVTSLRCGKIYSPGQLIPDGVLSDRDLKTLLELGSIKVRTEDVPFLDAVAHGAKPQDRSASLPESPPPSEEAEDETSLPSERLTSQSILDYVNSADVATLEKIKGVGKTTAKAMASHGTFASIKELQKLVPNVNWDSIQIEGNN